MNTLEKEMKDIVLQMTLTKEAQRDEVEELKLMSRLTSLQTGTVRDLLFDGIFRRGLFVPGSVRGIFGNWHTWENAYSAWFDYRETRQELRLQVDASARLEMDGLIPESLLSSTRNERPAWESVITHAAVVSKPKSVAVLADEEGRIETCATVMSGPEVTYGMDTDPIVRWAVREGAAGLGIIQVFPTGVVEDSILARRMEDAGKCAGLQTVFYAAVGSKFWKPRR